MASQEYDLQLDRMQAQFGQERAQLQMEVRHLQEQAHKSAENAAQVPELEVSLLASMTLNICCFCHMWMLVSSHSGL